jgi:hypothetical protein
LAILALTASAFMTVLLPTNSAPIDEGASRHATAEQAPAGDATLERVAPEPRGHPVVVAVDAPAATEAPALTEGSALTEPPAAEPVAVAAPRAAALRPVPTAAPVVVAPPAACPATFFCYPRLGISGPIVPYSDCSGATDVGTAIRRLTCVRAGIWLAGHAYTQFGGITGYRAGDVVFVLGQRFEITGASVQRSCAPATGAIAPLSLQTSLESATCGQVLVVQGR